MKALHSSKTTRPRTASVESPPVVAESRGTVKSLAKGLRALDLLLQENDVGTTELANSLDIDKGAASRILKTLAESGFAVQGAGRRYHASPRLRAAASPVALPAGVSIRERARPLLERLHSITQESSTLAVRADDQVLYLDKVDTELMLRVSRPVGTLSPLHCTALGKIFLAFSNAPLPLKLVGYTGRTPVTETALRATLRDIVARGYALDDEEFALGIRCAAAPLRDGNGQLIAAIGLSGPTARITTAKLQEFGELTKAIAADFTL
jgi:DNA-binding IclR family transcriptional regulator